MGERNDRLFGQWCTRCHKPIIGILDSGIFRHQKREDDLDHQALAPATSPYFKSTITPDKLA